MTIGLADLAKEALKPASGTIDAILAPKLARLNQWALERDLQSRISNDRLEEAFEAYMRRLLRRCSGLSTIVFPQQVLPLPQLYEPLSLRERHNGRPVALAEATASGSRLYVIDGAGMGKSTFVKHLVLELASNTEVIPVLLELRRIRPDENLIDAVARELDELGRPFERDVLLRLLSRGNFLLILDGFDEVPTATQKDIARQIEMLADKCSQSTIILTARPETSLPAMPDGQALEFDPLSNEQAQSLVRRYDMAGGLTVGERLLAEFPLVPERFLETPLLVALLYRTFGFNGSISTRVSTFYDELYTALYKGHDLTKAGFSREKQSALDIEEFRRLLRAFAFLLVSQERDSLASYSDAVSTVPDAVRLSETETNAPAFVSDLLSAVPLLIRDGPELRFIHKTVGEFFAAEFLSYSANNETLVAKIDRSPLRRRFSEVFSFLSEINPSIFRRVVAAPVAREVIRHLVPGESPVVLSLTFLGDTQVGIWPRHVIERRDQEVGSGLDIPDVEIEHPAGQAFFYGVDQGVEYVVAVALGGRAGGPINVTWDMLTVDHPTYSIVEHSGHDFSRLATEMPMREWIKLDDDRIAHLRRQPPLEEVLAGSLIFVSTVGRSFGSHFTGLRILNREKANELLRKVDEEQKTEAWLNELLDDDLLGAH